MGREKDGRGTARPAPPASPRRAKPSEHVDTGENRVILQGGDHDPGG